MRRECLPNAVTLANLAAGFASLILTTDTQFELAALAILAAVLLDGLDGRLARSLGVTSRLGEELDSLADVVSFGVAPALLLYVLSLRDIGRLGVVVAGLFVLCAAFRLARFNVEAPAHHFVGLPSTAAGGIVASFVLYGAKPDSLFYLVVAITLATLMVSRFPYPDFKRLHLVDLRRSKVFLIVAVTFGVALIDPRKLVFLPLAAYLLLGPKDSWLATRTTIRQARERINSKEG